MKTNENIGTNLEIIFIVRKGPKIRYRRFEEEFCRLSNPFAYRAYGMATFDTRVIDKLKFYSC